MKKILVVIMMLMVLSGCSGLNVSTATSVATDIAFTMVLKNNPSYKPVVVNGLNALKTVLNGEVTYDDLITIISKKFAGEYSYVAVLITAYIDTDKPVFSTYLPLFDEYKQGVVDKIDRFLMLASI